MERTGFAEREAGVEAIPRGYHEYVAGRFERWPADRADAPGREAAGGGPDAGFATLRPDAASFMRSAVGLYRDPGFEAVEGGESVTDVPAALRDGISYVRAAVDDVRVDDAR